MIFGEWGRQNPDRGEDIANKEMAMDVDIMEDEHEGTSLIIRQKNKFIMLLDPPNDYVREENANVDVEMLMVEESLDEGDGI